MNSLNFSDKALALSNENVIIDDRVQTLLNSVTYNTLHNYGDCNSLFVGELFDLCTELSVDKLYVDQGFFTLDELNFVNDHRLMNMNILIV
ncbi:hypothetical protein L0B53_19255 (plasmid) [Vibrio sp. SS-MA-C1-2]|uniref:hypothetical protein n=1 Tax=Vibrio sp. SS-MA-C1-2 TaxID=2908646 RepID=UPI001F17684C|nr:hypothetical protein [Vibrio sp. SS-MA-C1-2]UJF20273.1 hypothetical protein L0B53_19255 [Vibrio sp. SS-MA-C1-2]